MHSPRNAFRETFLLDMPVCNREVVRRFGEVVLEHALEISSVVPGYEQDTAPFKRKALRAVLADIEYAVHYLEILLAGETEEYCEARLSEAAEEAKAALLTALENLRRGLGTRRPIPRS
jgi:hypothetical protein